MTRTLHLEGGTTLGGRYVLRRPIREGTGGPVWEAEDVSLRTGVTLHLLVHAPDPGTAGWERMRRTVATVSWPWFHHPNVPRVLRLDDDGDVPVAVGERTAGETVRARAERVGPPTVSEAVRIVAVVADAVEAAHEAGVAHGSVGPETVLLTEGGGVMLLDLGLTPASWEASVPSDPGAAPWAREPLPAGVVGADVRALTDLLEDLLGPGAEPTAIRTVIRDVRDGAATHPRTAGAFAAALLGSVAIRPNPEPAPGTADHRAPRHGRRGLRVAVVAAVLGALIGVAALVQTKWGGSNGAVPSAPARSPAVSSPSVPLRETVAVPAVTGLSAADAQRRLLAAGLALSTVRPVAGTPGSVMRSDPQPGATVAPGTGVTLFVGADPNRLFPSPSG